MDKVQGQEGKTLLPKGNAQYQVGIFSMVSLDPKLVTELEFFPQGMVKNFQEPVSVGFIEKRLGTLRTYATEMPSVSSGRAHEVLDSLEAVLIAVKSHAINGGKLKMLAVPVKKEKV